MIFFLADTNWISFLFLCSNNYDISRNSFGANIGFFALFTSKHSIVVCRYVVLMEGKQPNNRITNICVSLKIEKSSIARTISTENIYIFWRKSKSIYLFLTFSLNERNFRGMNSRIFKWIFTFDVHLIYGMVCRSFIGVNVETCDPYTWLYTTEFQLCRDNVHIFILNTSSNDIYTHIPFFSGLIRSVCEPMPPEIDGCIWFEK